jgi:hypothetical protein
VSSKKSDIWRKDYINQAKRQIKNELDDYYAEHGSQAKLRYCLDQIAQLEDATAPQDFLRRFILVISALYHHQRSGGLSQKQINDLTELAYAILKLCDVKPVKSQASFLYGELHFVLSEIHLAKGEFLEALWEHQVGDHLSSKTPEMIAARMLDMGINALRLGNTALATRFLDDAFRLAENPVIQAKCLLHKMRSLRLSGRSDEALALSFDLEQRVDDPSFHRECHWERICCDLSASQIPTAMLKVCRRGGSHYQTSYLLECFMWLRSLSKKEWYARLPKLQTMNQYKEIKFRSYPAMFEVAQKIEDAYDTDIPFAVRLTKLKGVIKRIPTLRNVDKELLAWLAITRWLYRSRYTSMAAITWFEYVSLSQRVTEGRSNDALGIAKDLEQVDWPSKVSH